MKINKIGQGGGPPRSYYVDLPLIMYAFYPVSRIYFFSCMFLRDSILIVYDKNRTWKKFRRLSSVVWYGNPPTNILVNMVSLCEGVMCAVR